MSGMLRREEGEADTAQGEDGPVETRQTGVCQARSSEGRAPEGGGRREATCL